MEGMRGEQYLYELESLNLIHTQIQIHISRFRAEIILYKTEESATAHSQLSRRWLSATPFNLYTHPDYGTGARSMVVFIR